MEIIEQLCMGVYFIEKGFVVFQTVLQLYSLLHNTRYDYHSQGTSSGLVDRMSRREFVRRRATKTGKPRSMPATVLTMITIARSRQTKNAKALVKTCQIDSKNVQ